MSGSQHFNKIAWAITALMLAVTILFMNGCAWGLAAMTHTMGYENRLFDNTRVHTIDIVMDDWEELLANATSEEYYTAAMVIDGEAYHNIGIRGKGNTSLSTVAAMDSDRYSFKVEFDHYDRSITYHGLDKLSLNNLIQDATMMKDYLTYTMMRAFGVAAPLCSFVYMTVNGEDWGLYLAVEGVEDSFLERNYGANYGNLYKPDRMDDGNMREPRPDGAEQVTMPPPIPERTPSELAADRGDKPDFGGHGGMGAANVKLQYIDDNLDRYANIWNNAKTEVTTSDQTRLIASLKKLSSCEQLESIVNVEAVIRYFVVHNYVCNGDSYTGAMVHNYYLYEENGQMAMIPWDYNLAFGTFHGGDAQSIVNTPIDAPVSGGANEDRPMWNWILSDETYTKRYHQYFSEFLNTLDVQTMIDNAYQLIQPYVAKDPTAFYTTEEFETGVATMQQFCALRSESIATQLANGDTTNMREYVDASELTLSDMGSMGMGGGFDSGRVPEGSPQRSGTSALPPSDGAATTPSDQAENTDATKDSNRPFSDPMPRPGGEFNPNQDGRSDTTTISNRATWIWLGISVLILAAGVLVVKLYKR